MDKTQILSMLKVREGNVDEYISVLNDHEQRVEFFVSAPPGGKLGDFIRIRDLSLVARQTLLHRATELVKGAGISVCSENGYSLALCVRAHFETTAALGYLHSRLHSLKGKNITPEAMDRDLSLMLLGSRDDQILAIEGAAGFEAKQILTMMEHADKSVSKNIFGGKANEHKMLMDGYKWLCEFCHPNFHSNKLAFNLAHERKGFDFRHGGRLDDDEASILGYLQISGPIFIHLYDEIEQLLPET